MVLADDKHTHAAATLLENIRICTKLCVVEFAPNMTLGIQDKRVISVLLQTGCMFWNIFIIILYGLTFHSVI
jgi:hypothetical protein